MMTTLKSMGQSVQSLGNKALAHPHWAGKVGYALLAVTLLAFCGIAVIMWAGMYLPVHLLTAMMRRSNQPRSYADELPHEYDGFPDGRPHACYEVGDPRSLTENND